MFLGLSLSLVLSTIPSPDTTIAAPSRSGRTIEKIEARVGSQIILSSELQEATDQVRKTRLQVTDPTAVRKIAFDMLIEMALIREFLQKNDMAVLDQDVERQINNIRTAQGLQNYDELKKMLALQGTNLEQSRQDVRSQLEMQSFTAAPRRDSLPSIQDAEIKSYYQQNKDQFQKNYELSVQECTIAGDEPNGDALFFEEIVQFPSRTAGEVNKKDRHQGYATIPAPRDFVTCELHPGFYGKSNDNGHGVQSLVRDTDPPDECPKCAQPDDASGKLESVNGFVSLLQGGGTVGATHGAC